jgi:ATP-dependent helicase HrpB
VLTERGLGGDSVDLATRLAAFRHDRSARADDARRLARGLAAKAETALTPNPSPRGRGERALLPRGEGGRPQGVRKDARPAGRAMGRPDEGPPASAARRS